MSDTVPNHRSDSKMARFGYWLMMAGVVVIAVWIVTMGAVRYIELSTQNMVDQKVNELRRYVDNEGSLSLRRLIEGKIERNEEFHERAAETIEDHELRISKLEKGAK